MSYRVTAEFADEASAKSLVKKAKQMGGTANYESLGDMITGIVKAVPTKFYHLYAILRKGEVGYVGQTSATPPTARLDQHVKTARNPFYPWLNEGLEANDIETAFYTLGQVTQGQANAKEELAIRRLQPLYNRNGKLPLYEGNSRILAAAFEDE